MEDVDAEIEAIRTILNTLKPLDERTRETIMGYVGKRLNLQTPLTPADGEAAKQKDEASGSAGAGGGAVAHIKDLRDEKRPGSNVEMAVLVAYYLSELAEASKRRETVSAQDLDTYFKIAGHPKPAAFKDVLRAAKNGGYMDSSGHGQYKLNAVGYNLAVHTLPRNKAKS